MLKQLIKQNDRNSRPLRTIACYKAYRLGVGYGRFGQYSKKSALRAFKLFLEENPYGLWDELKEETLCTKTIWDEFAAYLSDTYVIPKGCVGAATVTIAGLKWDQNFKCLFSEVAQTKSTKLKLIAFAAGVDRFCDWFICFLDYFVTSETRHIYDPDRADWLIPELNYTDRANTTIGM
ncbi:hypothetical protein CYMTET_31993 [Cymbomonas tetramitiformis]|uniref:Uncharacterized protein n=1 Tax=Cymbomonas tetramitiformis TaxID=36881 RepID=A0AAE0FGJ2_9CHLO|nr:hypothetical protein CYMTET_31993 [Cymbomonas tetramitiformis]